MVTFVTAFLLQDCDRGASAKIESYLTRFQSLAALPINLIVFLDPQLTLSDPPPNVRVIPKKLSDTHIYKEYEDVEEPVLPPTRSVQKDTAQYMMIQNAKIEFLLEASKLDPSQQFAWIDFGILYVLREPATSLPHLPLLAANPPRLPKGNLFASINAGSHDQLFDRICWRFAGGFFLFDRDRIQPFYDAYCQALKEIKPALTWEVNVWAWLERRGRFDFDAYYGNHDDTMLTNIPKSS